MNGHGKLVIGSGIIIFLSSAIFWAGATYQQVRSIEVHIISMDVQIARIAENQEEVTALKDELAQYQRRTEKLEDQIRQLK